MTFFVTSCFLWFKIFGFSLILLHPALQNGVADNFFAGADVEFFLGIGFVRFDGFDGKVELFGDFFVAVTECDEAQSFRFAFG